jgi:hypothetical protein
LLLLTKRQAASRQTNNVDELPILPAAIMLLSRLSCRGGASVGRRLVHSGGGGVSSPFAHLKKLSESDTDRLVSRLAAVAGEKNVSLADAVRSQHGQDEGPDFGVKPDVVVYPQSTEEVSEVRNGSAIVVVAKSFPVALLVLEVALELVSYCKY